MSPLSPEESARREKTLLASLLLSMWGPLTTGLAVLLSHSTTQLADFLRRSVELVALFISWWVFRFLERNPGLEPGRKARLEKIAGFFVAAALCCSGAVMLLLALSRVPDFEPGGNVYPGLAIAVLGLVTNTWFWRRYARMTREFFSTIIHSQAQLYRAKALVDLCVIAALTAVAVHPEHPATRCMDVLGSVVLAAYLLWSGFRAAQAAASPASARREEASLTGSRPPPNPGPGR